MSGWAEERKILESWFLGQWKLNAAPNNSAGVPVAVPGMLFDSPTDGRPWMSMDLIGSTEGVQVELGTPALDRYVGIVQFTINVPIGVTPAITYAGPNQRAREIADALDRLWKRRRFITGDGTCIRCRVPGYHVLGTISQRFVAVLSVPYLRDEISGAPAPVVVP